ncbi:MAG: hypothetical protein ACTS7I_03135 [Candidatus Hodgkinia cicadicola]
MASCRSPSAMRHTWDNSVDASHERNAASGRTVNGLRNGGFMPPPC